MNHEAGVTDASVHHLVAVYETETDAEAARISLIQAGLEPGEVQMSRAASADDRRVTETTAFENKSFWGKLKDMMAFAPPHHHALFAEGLLRGHAILTLSPPAAARERMVALLESTNPIDFNARQSEWRAAGWQAPAERGPSAVGRVHTYAADQVTGLPPSPAAGDPSI